MPVTAPPFKENLIARIDALPREELQAFRRYLPTDLRHYMTIQKKWVEKDIYFLGCELGQEPTQAQVAERVLTGPNSLRYRAYYAMCYPERVYVAEEE